MGFKQSIDGSEIIPTFDTSNYGDIKNYSLKTIYDSNYIKYGFSGDYVMVAMWKAGTSADSYIMGFLPINRDIYFYTIDFIEDTFKFNNNNPRYYNTSSVYIDSGFSNVNGYIYNGRWGVQFNASWTTFGTWKGDFFNVEEDENHPTYIYTPKWENANGVYSVYLNNALPVILNYKPIESIFGNGNNLKLSMIKEEYTLGGKDMNHVESGYIQRFTDPTNLYILLKSLPVDSMKIIGYTDDNNFVALRKSYDETTVKGGVLEYYINDTHIPSLDFEIVMQYPELNPEVEYRYYLSYLVDNEHEMGRQSIIVLYSDGTVSYNTVENSRGIVTDEYKTLMFRWLSSGYTFTESEDPQEQGGTSSTGGGNGSYNNIGDAIGLPSKPSISAVDTNFITVYNPTLLQIKELANYMWGSGFNIESFKKIFTNPMDCIIGLHIVPCGIPNNGVQQVKVGNLKAPVTMNLAKEQFVDVDCGSIKVNEYWGSYLDYAPYTKISIYLPYIGTQTLSTDDVMNKTVSIKYRIDIITGACTCFIIVDGTVMYQYTGYCSASIPVSAQDYKSTVSSIISIGTTAVGVGTAIATGGLSAPMMAVGLGSTANNVMNGKPNIAHGNSASGTGGFMSVQTPYITITRARQCLPKNQKSFTGYPSYTTKKLSTLTGFTQIEEIHLDNLSCTNSERSEIENLLKGGIIV